MKSIGFGAGLCFCTVSFCTGLLLLVLSPATYSQESVVAPQGKPKLLSSDYKFTEGPAMDAEGNVYFTDQPNNQILKVDLDQKITVFLKPSGRSNVCSSPKMAS